MRANTKTLFSIEGNKNRGNFCLSLLPRDLLIKTSRVDQPDWIFRPLLGSIIRVRFKFVVDLLANHRFHRLLEVGYGSGIFMPELNRHCDELYGIDTHQMNKTVMAILEKMNVNAKLFSGSLTATPFDRSSFDCIITVSTLEFIDDIDSACLEVERILKPKGLFIVVTPGYSPVVDFGLKILTGESARENYANRRQALRQALKNYFVVQREIHFPSRIGSICRLYTAFKLQRR